MKKYLKPLLAYYLGLASGIAYCKLPHTAGWAVIDFTFIFVLFGVIISLPTTDF